MLKPRICVALTTDDRELMKEAELLADLIELRIDLIGANWREMAAKATRPWIACNRLAAEGGGWKGSETERIDQLMEAIELGAEMIDIELGTKNLVSTVSRAKERSQCLISYHNLENTPSGGELAAIVEKQVAAGADVCKVVTTARHFEDNLTVLGLLSAFPDIRLVAFAMGPLGHISRVLSPMAGGDFTYASIARGKESAPGQITVREMRDLYGMIA